MVHKRARRAAGVATTLAIVIGFLLAATAPAWARFAPERLFSAPGPARDDWEPSVAAGSGGHVLRATTRYSGPRACPRCPQPAIVLERSSDGGATWSGPRFLCRCPGVDGQFDPVLVADDNGDFFAAWMNDFNVHFARSDDNGRTWSQPIKLHGRLAWSDKPWIGVSGDGTDVYVTFNGPGHSPGAPYTVSSHDGGRTWSAPIPGVRRNQLYWFAGGLTVTPSGAVFSSQDVYHQDYRGRAFLFVLRSLDGGRSWDKLPIAISKQGHRCPRGLGCGLGFFGPQIASASDDTGRVYVLWNEAHRKAGPTRVYLRWSDTDGQTWSKPVKVSTRSRRVDSEFPMLAATGTGDVRVAWMDDRTGRWNTWYRRSIDGGLTWSHEVRLSNRPSGAPYKSVQGFRFPYGDYGQIDIDDRGRTHAVWGESRSYIGPGGSWYTRGT